MATCTFGGVAQYQLTDGALALTWINAWAVTRNNIIVSGSHNLTLLLPPHPEGCLTQLSLQYTVEADTHDEAAEYAAEVNTAIWDGGVAQADCDSHFYSN